MSVTAAVTSVGVKDRGAALTPATFRDSFVDLLRVASVLLIVFGHWISSTVWWWDGRVGANSILVEQPWLAPASWVVVTVPVLFFAGGFANITSYRRVVGSGGSSWAFIARRARRLLAPTMSFLSVWLAIEVVLHTIGVGGDGIALGVSPRGLMPFGPLWFLTVYLVIIALCPLTVRVHDRFGLAVPVALVVAAAVTDAARFVLDLSMVGWVNLVLAWLLPHQLGYCYADGRLSSDARRANGALCGASLVGLVGLTASATYPTSIGGLPGDGISNMRPPTMVIVALSLWQIGMLLAIQPRARAALRSRQLASAVQLLNRHAMSIYLWHMTALLVVVLVLAPFGLSRDHQPVASFWLQRPLVLGLSSMMLALIIVMPPPSRGQRTRAQALELLRRHGGRIGARSGNPP